MSGPLVVVGDVLLDRDVSGAVTRVCPDAPVPVLDERSATDRPGGAGLAALLAAAGGHEVALVTALADDAGGARLAELLAGAGVTLYPLPLPGATPEKIRLRAGGQTLLRLDRGGEPQPVAEPPEAALAALRAAGAILASDYGRGLLRQPALRAALADASAPVVWDPHPRGPAAVTGVRLATPNLAELRQVTGDAGGGSPLSTATRAGHELRRRWRVGAVSVTMGPDGAVLCHSGSTPLVVPPPSPVERVEDTCGAGDRFAVTAATALGRGVPVSEAVQEAVAAATAYVAAGGAAGLRTEPPRPDPAVPAAELVARVRSRGGTVVATGGCFDILHAGHLATLEAARRLGDALVVCLNSDRGVRGLKGPDRPINGEADRARLLAALDCVDAVVVFDEPTPHAVLSRLRPDVWVKGGDYAGDGAPDLPEADLVRSWGGRVVTVPYLAGRSTTATVTAARSRGGHLVKGAA